MSFTNVFSNNELPPSDVGFASYTLTTDTVFSWPSYLTEDTLVIADITELSAGSGVAVSLPPANQVSVGEGFVLRNTGSIAINIVSYGLLGITVGSLNPGYAVFFYTKDNTTQAGTWGSVHYGVGSSQASASDLAGYGTKATSSKLSVAIPTVLNVGDLTVLDTHRAQIVDITGGVATVTLGSISSYSADFFVYVKNSGTGTVTVVPYSGETVDGSSSFPLQPGESIVLISNNLTTWLTVGYGRSTLYQFSSLTLDVSAGGTFTLSGTQASNKMITCSGNPSAVVTVILPSIVGVYYVANNLSTTNSVTFKTVSGTGSIVGQSQRAVLLCDGTIVTSAQTAPTTSIQSLLDGSVTAPSLNFSSKTNTGIYKFSTDGFGISVGGVAQLTSNGAGIELPLGMTYQGVKFKTSNTGSLVLPVGTTAQRDGSPSVGYMRFNTTTGKTEHWNGTAWVAGGGAAGGGGDDVFYENSTTVTANYTITAGKNAISAGPITINDGVTVTIPDGSIWSIV